MDINRDIEFHDLVFIDLETTGLDVVTGDSICEIGAYKVRNRETVESFHTLINPGRTVPRQAYLIHKISDDDLKSAPFFGDIAGNLMDFLRDCVICAYNIKFDIGFLNHHFKTIDYPLINYPAIDILGMAREVLDSDKYNLIAVAEFLKLKYDKEKVHRASEDAFMASMIFFELLNIFRAKRLEKLKYFLSLFGFPNDIFMEEQNKKMSFFLEAVERASPVYVKYFPQNKLVAEKNIVPLRLTKEGRSFLLWYNDFSLQTKFIAFDRILEARTADV